MTLLHEFGHAIGLRHSDNKADIMYKELQRNRVILSIGDVLAAQAFYGVPFSVRKLLHQSVAWDTNHTESLSQTNISGTRKYLKFVCPSIDTYFQDVLMLSIIDTCFLTLIGTNQHLPISTKSQRY